MKFELAVPLLFPPPGVTFPVSAARHAGANTVKLPLGTALARTADVLRPGMIAPFRDYVRVVLADLGVEIETLFGPEASCQVSVDGNLVDGPESRLPAEHLGGSA